MAQPQATQSLASALPIFTMAHSLLRLFATANLHLCSLPCALPSHLSTAQTKLSSHSLNGIYVLTSARSLLSTVHTAPVPDYEQESHRPTGRGGSLLLTRWTLSALRSLRSGAMAQVTHRCCACTPRVPGSSRLEARPLIAHIKQPRE